MNPFPMLFEGTPGPPEKAVAVFWGPLFPLPCVQKDDAGITKRKADEKRSRTDQNAGRKQKLSGFRIVL